jgi:cyanophycin synthetase
VLETSGESVSFLSAQARYAAHTAAVCGYAFRSLDGADGYLFEVRDGARAATFAAGAGTPYALNDARAAALARDKAFCAEVLRSAGVPVLAGRMFFITERWREMRSPGRELDDALAFGASAEYPLFCKPISASNGLYAEVVESEAALADYLQRAACEHFAVLVQPYVQAPEHRVFVLNGSPLFSYKKSPPFVRGDGRRSLGELVRAMSREGPGLKPRGRDANDRLLAADDVPPAGALIALQGPANRAAGGGASALREGASEAIGRLAVAAAAAIGLSLAAVDLFEGADSAGDFTVIEVNSNPMIATLEEHGRWDLIERIWRANFAAAMR